MNTNVAACAFVCLFMLVQPVAAQVKVFHQAEPNPPSLVRTVTNATQKVVLASSPTLYSIGDPTDNEQLYLELINRARANPPAEGVWLANLTDPDVVSAINYFNVDLGQMMTEFNAISPAQPLAFNSILIGTARVHSQNMYDQQTQAHVLSGESDLGTRIHDAGYSWSSVGENIYAYSESTLYGHAGLQIDWGSDAGGTDHGMQSERGHRANTHNANYREIGVGIKDGVNGPVGPQLVTEDFGAQSSSTPLITGVAYLDVNTNSFYDVGEGLGNVTVEVSGANYYAITAASGGYAVPVPGDGDYTVTFTAPDGGVHTTNVTVASGLNVKADLILPYQPVSPAGSANPVVGFNMSYTFTPNDGVTDYAWRAVSLSDFPFADHADDGLNNFNSDVSSGYSVTGADDVVTRSSVFHLAQPDGASQTLEMKQRFYPSTSASLTFYSRLGYANSTQIAKVQVSQDDGATWTDIWTQAGNDTPEGVYSQASASLSSLPVKETRLRFNYAHDSGSYYYDTDYYVGWMFDDIVLSGVFIGGDAGSGTVSNTNKFTYTASGTGTYLLEIKPNVSGRSYPGGETFAIQSVSAPTVTMLSPKMISGGDKQFDVSFSHAAGGAVGVLSATSITGPWTPDNSASVQTLTTEQSFRITVPAAAGNHYFQAVLGPQ